MASFGKKHKGCDSRGGNRDKNMPETAQKLTIYKIVVTNSIG